VACWEVKPLYVCWMYEVYWKAISFATNTSRNSNRNIQKSFCKQVTKNHVLASVQDALNVQHVLLMFYGLLDSCWCLSVLFSDVTDWINAFSRQTQTNWNVRDTHKKLQILQRKDFVCHMKDFCNRPKKFAKSSHRYKHCDCPATIKFKVMLFVLLAGFLICKYQVKAWPIHRHRS